MTGTQLEKNFFDKYKDYLKSKNIIWVPTTLLECAYLIKNSELFIGRDSGLYHLTHSLNKKGIIFFLKKNKKYQVQKINMEYIITDDEDFNFNLIVNKINILLNNNSILK